MVTCPYCQQDTAGNHAWNCPMNPVNINNGEWQLNNLIQPKPNYYHVSWLEIAVRNFKNDKDVVHTVEGSMLMKEFIKRYAREELSKIVDIE